MRETSETVREVCAEAKAINRVGYWNAQGKTVEDLINRILSAYVREEVSHMAYVAKECAKVKAECEREMAAKVAEIARLVTDCNRLKAALKPVMECRVERIDGLDSPDCEFMTSSEYGVCDADGNEVDNHSIASALNAVREAKRVMLEGGN